MKAEGQVGRSNANAALARTPSEPLVTYIGVEERGDSHFSELFPALRHHGLSVGRTMEVLARIGLLDDDRVPAFDRRLAGKLSGLAPGIAADVEAWAHLLHEGGPRQRARSIQTVWSYLTEIQPILLAWSGTYDHLREVTCDDVVAIKDTLQGAKRENTIVALRSLMRFCRKTGWIFRDPTLRIRIARRLDKVILPSPPARSAAPSPPRRPWRPASFSPWPPSTRRGPR